MNRNMPQTTVYVASKVDQAETILTAFKGLTEIALTSTWPQLILDGQSSAPSFARHFWQRDFDDIDSAQWLICYAPKKNSLLRGALIETGYAIAHRKRVILAGHKDTEAFSTWQHYSRLSRADTLEEAIATIQLTRDLGV